MNISEIEKIDFRKSYGHVEYSILHKQDKLCIGTEHFQGFSYFHNYEYRHLLRSKGDYNEWRTKGKKSKKPWHKLYKAIHDRLMSEGLATDGFSREHTKIVAEVLKLPVAETLKTYHER